MSKKTSMMVIVILFAISLLCRWLFVPVQAIELFESGTVDWVEQLDPDLQEQLESYGISMEHPEELQQFSVGSIFKTVLDGIQKEITSPIRLLLLFLAVILCSALLHAVQHGKNAGICRQSGYGCCYSKLSIVCTVCSKELCDCFSQGKAILSQCTDFMTLFTPVFSMFMTATGQFGSAAIYQTSSLFLTNGILQILDHILLPFLSMSFAIAIANAVYAEHTLDGLLQFNKTIVTWSLGFLMSVFIGVISIQSIVSSAADGLTTKTTKYVVSNFVPIVGGAVSDAYATVLGSLQVLKSTTGAIGIVVLLLIFLPILLRVVLYRLVLKLAVACADLFSVSQVSRFLKGAEQVLSMLFAILTCFAVLFLVTVALLLLISRPNL